MQRLRADLPCRPAVQWRGCVQTSVDVWTNTTAVGRRRGSRHATAPLPSCEGGRRSQSRLAATLSGADIGK